MQPNCNTQQPAAPERAGYEDIDRTGLDDGDVQLANDNGPDVAEAYDLSMPHEEGKRGRIVRMPIELQMAEFFEANGESEFARKLRESHRRRMREMRTHRITLVRSRVRTRRPTRRGFRRMARRSTSSTVAGGGDPDPDPERRAVGIQGKREEVRDVRA